MSMQDDDRISRKSQGSNLKDFSKSLSSSIGFIFKKQNSIKIAPINNEMIRAPSLDYPEDHQLKNVESQ
jgi:hypothetical protein